MSDEVTATLGYWDCRGLAEIARLLLEYSGAKYTFVGHKSGPAPFYDKKEWMARKNELLADFDFPNLPYYRLALEKLIHSTLYTSLVILSSTSCHDHFNIFYPVIPAMVAKVESGSRNT